MITVTKEFTFEAGHHLPNYCGQCQNPHGHSYRLQVTMTGLVNPTTGMVVDFGKIKEETQRLILQYLDHSYLNDVRLEGFPHEMPTAENLVIWMANRLLSSPSLASLDVRLVSLRLWETATSYVEWKEG